MTENLICNPRCATRQSSLHLSLASVWEIHTTFSNLWRKKCSPIIYSAEPQVIFCLRYHLIRDMSSYSVVVDHSRHLSHDVPVTGKIMKREQKYEKCIYHPRFFLLCHSADETCLRQRVSWEPDCDVGAETECAFVCVTWVNMCACVCVQYCTVCAKKSWGFYPGGLGHPFPQHFPPTCSIQVLDHKSSSLPLININIVLYYPLLLTLVTP